MEPRGAAMRALAVAAYAAAAIAFLLVQELGLRLRHEEQRAWWAGTGRDLLNAAGLVAIAAALRLLGLSWAAALLVGGTLTLAMFGASVLVATQLTVRRPRAWSFGIGAALAAAVLLFAPEILGALAGAADALFPLPASGPP
jgi:hypothetical protein